MTNNEYEIKIRPAKLGDEAEIANVHLNSWREAYRGLLPQDFLDQLPLTFKRRRDWWQKVISEPNKFVLQVAEGKAGIVGFVCLEPGRDEDMKDLAEVAAIYLLQKFKGSGVGFSLLSSGLKQMEQRGFKKAYCWVLEKNPTIKFYERTGAKLHNKTKSAEIGGQSVQEVCLYWNDIRIGG